MDSGWVIDRRIVCIDEEDAQVTVFRIMRKQLVIGQKKHRYVLGNSARVMVVPDSKFQIVGTETLLQPVYIHH